MTKTNVMGTLVRTNALLLSAALLASLLVPMLLRGSASAGQLTNRYVDMSANQTSEGSGRDGGDTAGQDVTYRVGFDLNQTHTNIRGIVIEFCSNGPIIDTACTAPTGFDVNEGTLAVTAVAGITGTWAIDAATDANTLILTNATGDNLAATTTVTLDLGTSAAADGITNPTTNGSFYARIVTYDSTANAVGYTDVNADAVGAHLDDGGVAMSVANELTITARVQESLEFCVGTTDAGTNSNCTDISGTDIDLGVVDSTSPTVSAANAGLAMITTNAANGAAIYYKTEQDTSSGKLKQAGETCINNTSEIDPCFNSATTTRSQISVPADGEKFGMAISSIDRTNGVATTNLICDDNYTVETSNTTCQAVTAAPDTTGYAWDDSGNFDTIATSDGTAITTSVLDHEMLNLQFAALAGVTTPTGLYSVTANFVATSTF